VWRIDLFTWWNMFSCHVYHLYRFTNGIKRLATHCRTTCSETLSFLSHPNHNSEAEETAIMLIDSVSAILHTASFLLDVSVSWGPWYDRRHVSCLQHFLRVSVALFTFSEMRANIIERNLRPQLLWKHSLI